jgi:hypothetical protein
LLNIFLHCIEIAPPGPFRFDRHAKSAIEVSAPITTIVRLS